MPLLSILKLLTYNSN